MANPACPNCGDPHRVIEAPEAGYWMAECCGERGSGPVYDISWWSNDPDSIWYKGDAP